MIEKTDVETLIGRLPELERQMSQPENASDRRKMQALVREHAALKKITKKADAYYRARQSIDEYEEMLRDDGQDDELREMATTELADTQAKLPGLETALALALVPPDPDDSRNAIVEIRAGTGGDEASLFAGDLFRMYSRFAEIRGWKVGLIDVSANDLGGYKEVVCSIEGENVYQEMRYESGVHRVQRVPVTESSGRIHTSAATVAVFPEAEAEDDLDIPADEVRIDIFRSSGPGGQSVNTTDSAVRLTHIPTGITVQCQDEKSQHRNRDRAMVVLKARILDLKRSEEAMKMGQTRRAMIGSGDRSERIRTYNFPQNRLTDHRVNLTLYSLDRLLEGDLTEIVESLRSQDLELRIAEELESISGEIHASDADHSKS
jgi:peptide chain release factor 1